MTGWAAAATPTARRRKPRSAPKIWPPSAPPTLPPPRRAAAGNALEECSGAKDNEAIKAALREHGALTALMTGSGAAVFGIFASEAEARTAAAALKTRWPQVYVAQPDKGGARVTAPKWML